MIEIILFPFKKMQNLGLDFGLLDRNYVNLYIYLYY